MTSASRVCLAGSQRTHPGRPENEDPHVKKTMKNKREITEYICKVDQDELGILEDEFDDLKDLFKVPKRLLPKITSIFADVRC